MLRFRCWLAAWSVIVLAGCAGLPPVDDRTATEALQDTDDTRLAEAIAPRVAAHPGKSGFHALADPLDAFAARVLLARAADRSLDVQYYIWRPDETGHLLLEALWRAAERGVRVRLLLDDINTAGMDQVIATLDAHPMIEVRLYNPLAQRDVRALNFITDFSRVNRRMHNKSFTADNQATVVGGRNVGNEYFGADTGVVFADLDVLAVGPAVRDVSYAFDRYWNSPSAYPAAALVEPEDDRAALEAAFTATREDPDAVAYIDAVRQTGLVKALLAGGLAVEWADARLVVDDPAKTLDTDGRDDLLLLAELLEVGGQPDRSFYLVSPYFVPGQDGSESLQALADRGVDVEILTNSLAATDVSAVHAGYVKRRRDLLRSGVRLFELKPDAETEDDQDGGMRFGSSSASLHAKTFAADGDRLFVGSFNFDQRSAFLNTELGLVIYSPALAGQLADAFADRVPLVAYEVQLADGGKALQWIERTPDGEIVHAVEPGTGALQRGWIGLLSVLPIEWLL
jgi:putative cardiolipin synthase